MRFARHEHHQQQARAATDPKAAQLLAELADARRRRAELLFAPATKDPVALAKRNEEIRTYEDRIEKLRRDLKPLLP